MWNSYALSACRFRSFCLHLKSINNFIEQFVNFIISTGKSTRVEWKTTSTEEEGKVLMLILCGWRFSQKERKMFSISIRTSHWIICRLENNLKELCVIKWEWKYVNGNWFLEFFYGEFGVLVLMNFFHFLYMPWQFHLRWSNFDCYLMCITQFQPTFQFRQHYSYKVFLHKKFCLKC